MYDSPMAGNEFDFGGEIAWRPTSEHRNRPTAATEFEADFWMLAAAVYGTMCGTGATVAWGQMFNLTSQSRGLVIAVLGTALAAAITYELPITGPGPGRLPNK